ncbi:hypothetical protein JCM16418_819 [Paenibacillus pini JCM 16418]|uniref:Uncharacterized protein n=2 Tax=Paenibacillus TaxID=44249 RepID=W7YQG4_9BACL|nr:hypothetical protein JCM16418_819 [Paenibacillus pini JCM 16418]
MVENDNRITSIIEALNHEYFISYESIALYAKLEQEDLQQFMNDSSSVTFEKRYKLAVTTLFLHSLFKQPQ